MNTGRLILLGDLLRERYGPTPTWERSAQPRPAPARTDGGPDTAAAIVRRRSALLDALDGKFAAAAARRTRLLPDRAA